MSGQLNGLADGPSVGSGPVEQPVFDFTEVFDDDYLYFAQGLQALRIAR